MYVSNHICIQYIYVFNICIIYVQDGKNPQDVLSCRSFFRKGATNCRALLRKSTCKDKASYGSPPPCIQCIWIQECLDQRCLCPNIVFQNVYTYTYICIYIYVSIYICVQSLYLKMYVDIQRCIEYIYRYIECKLYTSRWVYRIYSNIYYIPLYRYIEYLQIGYTICRIYTSRWVYRIDSIIYYIPLDKYIEYL